MFFKTQSWDAAARVPLIFSGPGIPKGKVRNTVVELLDLLPTIAHLAGLPVPTEGIEGKDITKVVRSSSEKQYTSYAAFTQNPRCGNHSDGQPWMVISLAEKPR